MRGGAVCAVRQQVSEKGRRKSIPNLPTSSIFVADQNETYYPGCFPLLFEQRAPRVYREQSSFPVTCNAPPVEAIFGRTRGTSVGRR